MLRFTRRPLTVAAASATPRRATPRRPTRDDVDSISRGGPSKSARGWGSRSVPHRLNSDEAAAFAAAKSGGLVRLRGTGYRAERSGSPLANTWRQWCDANGGDPAVLLLRRGSGAAVVVDLSPPRLPRARTDAALDAAAACLVDAVGGCVRLEGREAATTVPFTVWADGPADEEEEEKEEEEEDAPRLTEPIWRLRPAALVWGGDLADARVLAKAAAERARGAVEAEVGQWS